MKKIVHSISFEAFCYPTEDKVKVMKALDFIFPVEKEVEEGNIESYHGAKIVKLLARFEKQSQLKQILEHFNQKLSDENKRNIIDTLSDRIDDDGNVFVRFDKQEAFKEKLVLEYHGDVVKVRIKMAAFPFSLETAKQNMRDIFGT